MQHAKHAKRQRQTVYCAPQLRIQSLPYLVPVHLVIRHASLAEAQLNLVKCVPTALFFKMGHQEFALQSYLVIHPVLVGVVLVAVPIVQNVRPTTVLHQQ